MTSDRDDAKQQSQTSAETAPAATARLLDHEYDGIQEYDNPLPRWWVAIFWGTFVFAIGYFLYYHVLGIGPSIAASYTAEMRQVQAERARHAMAEKVSTKSLAKLMANPAVVKSGKALFAVRCQPCHAKGGKGLIGPNLTDDYWIHGKGTLMDIYHVVHDGVPDKGMPSWGRMLTPTELREAVAYVGTLRWTHVPGKAPQGNKVTPAPGK